MAGHLQREAANKELGSGQRTGAPRAGVASRRHDLFWLHAGDFGSVETVCDLMREPYVPINKSGSVEKRGAFID